MHLHLHQNLHLEQNHPSQTPFQLERGGTELEAPLFFQVPFLGPCWIHFWAQLSSILVPNTNPKIHQKGNEKVGSKFGHVVETTSYLISSTITVSKTARNEQNQHKKWSKRPPITHTSVFENEPKLLQPRMTFRPAKTNWKLTLKALGEARELSSGELGYQRTP